MIDLVKVTRVRALPEYRLWVRFSDRSEGIADLSELVAADAEVVRPLREPAVFEQVFVSYGVPTWPNGFDLDAIALHDRLGREGHLVRSTAAE